MKQLILIGMLLMTGISCYAQESQESYTLLMLEFENRTGLENPLLEMFNDTMAFVLSRQTGPVQVRMVPTSDRNALLARAAKMQPDATPLEQGQLAAEWVDADALITGSYTKQGEEWSLESQVYHRREDRKTRQEIQIQGDNFYKLLDGFPAQLFQQFAANYIALTTDSWKAYEEFREGLQQFENYNFFGALEHYDRALELDPTLALAYAEQNHVYAMMGQSEQATTAIEAAQKWMSKASPMEQLAIRALFYSWDSEPNTYRIWYHPWSLYDVKHIPNGVIIPTGRSLAPGGVWDEPLIYQLAAAACMQEGKRAEADQYHQQWFKAIQVKIRANPGNASLLHDAAEYCLAIRLYMDEAIAMALKGIELEPQAKWKNIPGYVLIKLYEFKGDIEQSAGWARRIIRELPDLGSSKETWPSRAPLVPGGYFFAWDHLATLMRDGKIPPERLLTWCEDMLHSSELPQPSRIRTQYLLAEIYHAMNDTAKVDATLAAMGAPRETDWMVIGPLKAPESGTDLFPETPPFAMLFANLAETHVGIQGKEMQWESWEDDQRLDGLLNIWWTLIERHYMDYWLAHGTISGIVYGCIYVEVPIAVEAQVRTGFGPMRIWLNENTSPVTETNGVYCPIPDRIVCDISLSAGLNRFLIGSAPGNPYGFHFRITDREGNAIPGLRYVSAKEVLASH